MGWREHELCGPAEGWPERFWGPEKLYPEAWRELAACLEPEEEVRAIVRALADSADLVDVGGGTGLIAQEMGVPVVIVEPQAEQREHVPAGIVVREGRAEAVPLADGAADAAMATWVLQYCDDPVAAVDELARVARRRVVIVQAAPGNELVDVWNLEAEVAGLAKAHHGWLLAMAAERLERAGFRVTLERVGIAARGISADALSRLHFAGHPKRAEMLARTEPYVRARGGVLRDDGVVLAAVRL